MANQHRWKEWIEDERILRLFEEAIEDLRWAWEEDQKYPNSYPLNTSHRLDELKSQLAGEARDASPGKFLRSPPPETLQELVDEETISAIYEEQNDGTYKEALKLAASGTEDASRAWQKIRRSIDAAYGFCRFGILPKPRVQFLHRNLLELLQSKHLRDLSLEGVIEFFEDVCPCGDKHKPDAIRKIAGRKGIRFPA